MNKDLTMIKLFWGDSRHNIDRNQGKGEYVVTQKAQEDINYLLSIIEQADTALTKIRDSAINYSDEAEYVVIADEALKAIRGN